MTTITTLLCGNCCSVNTAGNLVSSILLQNQYEIDGATTTISISKGLSSLFYYWMGVPTEDKLDPDGDLLHFCPDCAHIFRELHKISVQFLKLSGTESQVAKRLAELRKAHGIISSSPPPTFNKRQDKEVTQGQKLDLRNYQIDPIEENIEIKKDPEDELDLAVLIKEEEDIAELYDDHVSTGTYNPLGFDDGISETHGYGEIQLKTDGEDEAEDSEADEFAIDPLKLSDEESSNYSPSSGDEDDNDSEPDNTEPDNTKSDNTESAKSNRLGCSECFKTFASVETRDRHFKQQHDEKFTPLPCPADTCDLTFKRWDQLRTHITNYHPGVPCPPVRTRKVYKTKKLDEGGIPCQVATCDKKYSSNCFMYHHMRTVHPEVPPKMQRNAKGSQEAKEAKLKAKTTRKTKIKKPCPVCGKQFNSNFLNTHIRTHSDERKHLCTTCGKLFRTSRYLSLHIQHVHIREKKYHCDDCGKDFARNYEFKDHVKRLHGNLEKSEICETCGKTFRHQPGLRQHRQTHYHKDAFECPICPKTSNSKANIASHVRWVHEGRKRETHKKKKERGRVGRPPDDERRIANYARGDAGDSQNSSEQGYPALSNASSSSLN
ncbi:zinc finger protein 311 isoform X2 [Folsomia candida]|uniref:zinc finger protein 311 isoform X2 n=1 Tax=Folsomia candida TaxID=158441 RepID=UPI001604B8F6|nr:zinc finger protein 311 isoform X2 [Folsomia candida]